MLSSFKIILSDFHIFSALIESSFFYPCNNINIVFFITFSILILVLISIRCIYKPLSGGSSSSIWRKLFGTFSCFCFVFIWHGGSDVVLYWSLLNFLGIIIEKISEALSNNQRIRLWQVCHSGNNKNLPGQVFVIVRSLCCRWTTSLVLTFEGCTLYWQHLRGCWLSYPVLCSFVATKSVGCVTSNFIKVNLTLVNTKKCCYDSTCDKEF